MNHDHTQHDHEPPSFWRSRYAIGYVVFGGVALYYLLSEHLAHVLGVLPYLIFLACPLMHLFMHHGHGHHHGGHSDGHGGDAEPNAPRERNEGGRP